MNRWAGLDDSDDLFLGYLLILAAGDVCFDGVIKENGFLAYQTNLLPEPAELEGLQINPI
jgi:hypothetical protein